VPKPVEIWARHHKLVENTEPVVQLLFNESYPERGVEPKGLCWRRVLYLPTNFKFMNAAEEIVKFWYENQGYFCIESRSVPHSRGKEVDLLAIKLSKDKKTIKEKLHIEIQVSINSINDKTAEYLAELYDQSKFFKVKDYVETILGKGYKMVEVRGKICRNGKNIRDEYIKIRAEKNVSVIAFDSILEDVKKTLLTNTQLNPIIQTLQFTKFFPDQL